jgi:GDPmannose 4,6-dehydratase
MLQQDKPEDYCVGTGESHSVRDFVVTGFNYAGVEIEWQGKGIEEKGMIKSFDKKWNNILSEGQSIVEINPRYFRPTEVDFLQADISKAKEILKWQPKIKFDELVSIMVDHDMLLNGLVPPAKGIESVKNKGMTWTEHFSVELKEIANEI